MSQAEWEVAVDQAVEIARQAGITVQEFTDYSNDEAEQTLRTGSDLRHDEGFENPDLDEAMRQGYERAKAKRAQR